MVKILSWNIHTSSKKIPPLLSSVLTEIVNDKEHDIDIVVLQEAFGSFVDKALNSAGSNFYEIITPGNLIENGVRIFLKQNKFEQPYLPQKHERNKLFIVRLKLRGGSEQFNIAAVHLHSKVGNSERQQLWKNLPIINKIKECEGKKFYGNDRTIIVGDFNHNPYENNLCDPFLLNSKNSRMLISTLTSNPVTKKTDRDFWYNPMWNLLGDHDFINGNQRVTGTYFSYGVDEKPIWNLFDGIILRPSIMDRVDFNQSSILTSTKTTNFLKPFIIKNNESIINDQISDHLPVKFTININ